MLKSEPAVLVNVPDGATLIVDEREIPVSGGGSTSLTLSPGVETLIRVELEGYTTFEETYTLDYNEQRVIFFEDVGLSQ